MKAVPSTNAASLLQSTNELRDIRPPVIIPSGWEWLKWLVVALALLALAYGAWRWWRSLQAEKEAIPPVPPHVRARQRLEQAWKLLAEPKPFCIEVSDALRVYLEERYQFRAPERTTEEFLHELQATDLLSASQKASLADFLQRCDLVKFAKYEPAELELRNLHASALHLVADTEPAPAVHDAPSRSAVINSKGGAS